VAGSQKDIRKIIIQVESNFNDENEDKTWDSRKME
jgi:hypothetical protein